MPSVQLDEIKNEAVSSCRTFKESLPKCVCSLEISCYGVGGEEKPWGIGVDVYGDRDVLPGTSSAAN